MQEEEQERVDYGVYEGDVERDLKWEGFLLKLLEETDNIEIVFWKILSADLMWDRTLGRLPVQADVNESDHKERPPEDDVGESDDDEHLDVSDSLLLELYHQVLKVLYFRWGDFHQFLELLILSRLGLTCFLIGDGTPCFASTFKKTFWIWTTGELNI